MNWKNELIPSKNQAVDFIRARMKAAGIARPDFTLYEKEDRTLGPSSLYITSSLSKDNTNCQTLRIILRVEKLKSGKTNLDVVTFSVNEHFTGKGLALAGTKAILGIAHEYGAECIKLICTLQDGPTFWPTLGALPNFSYLDKLKKNISHSLKHDKELNHNEQAIFSSFIHAYKFDRVEAFRKLAVYKNEKIREITRTSLSGSDMTIRLDDPVTFNVLKDKLGILPPFRTTYNAAYKNKGNPLNLYH